jgi:pentatricopeptide repeat protein
VKALGLANQYTIANMMNARVRCGDIRGAVALLRDPTVRPGVVAYTTCIKGVFEAYDLATAETLLSQMQAAGVRPNLRTANTFLRGCMSVGAVESGVACYKLAQGKWSLTPDASTHEYMVALLCQALRVRVRNFIIARMWQILL